MSKVRAVTKPQLEQVPQEHREWFGRVLTVMNDFIDQSIKILNGGETFADQALGKDHVFDFVYQSDVISLPIGFAWPFAVAPKALQVVAATEDADTVNLSTSWQFTATGQVQLVSIVRFTSVPAVAALQAGSRYKIRVRVTP